MFADTKVVKGILRQSFYTTVVFTLVDQAGLKMGRGSALQPIQGGLGHVCEDVCFFGTDVIGREG